MGSEGLDRLLRAIYHGTVKWREILLDVGKGGFRCLAYLIRVGNLTDYLVKQSEAKQSSEWLS